MKEKHFKYFGYFILLFVIFLLKVNALDTSVNNDLVTIKQSSSIGFYIGNNELMGDKITDKNGYVNISSGYAAVSLKNGKYYAWVKNSNGSSQKKYFEVTNSCNDEVKKDQKGTYTLERCFVKSKSSSGPVSTADLRTVRSCASGYVEDKNSQKVVTNTCKNISLTTTINGKTVTLPQRYCKVVYSLTCVKDSTGSDSGGTTTPVVSAASLTSLSLNNGKLSPSFKSGTKKYNVTVESGVDSVKISATAAKGSTFVSGEGPRTVKLNYGSNTVRVKVKNSAGKVTTYTIVINRNDGRSDVNTLSNLTVSTGNLSPAFTSGNKNYTVDVANEISSITINATLTDNKSKFVAGHGPSSVSLEPGPNKIYIKVISEKGNTNVYNITVNRATTPSICTTQTDNLALLKEIKLSAGQGLEIDGIENFDSKMFVYEDLKVPFKASALTVEPFVLEEGDTFEIEGNDELEVNIPKEIKITVKSKMCPNYTNVYTLNITRQPEVVLGSNGELKSLTVKGHKEFEFEPNVLEYKLKLKKAEDKLEIDYETVEKNTVCVIEGNEDLQYASTVSVKCTSEDGEDIVEYTITIDGVQKGKNGFLIIIVVILIILVLIYLVLRLLGYRIYFNFAVIGAFFRGIGEKFKNMFDK